MIRSDTKSFTSTFSVARWDKSKTDTTWTRRHCKENANVKMYYLIKKVTTVCTCIYVDNYDNDYDDEINKQVYIIQLLLFLRPIR